ncbi:MULTISPECIES: hypothetical protein [Halomicrobium]|uniref:Uncharacterized protein n=2 Tax=Halomicrobium mukohataei TaxID=57705 RepID=C7NYD1_HALMD|nr:MULTISPECIES: hypothetical protein [Halomicrobium]ACV46592.1 conserved hypothetical protein [Halomicrobium mukohataei DSM 12286]QCD65132.1 hypothetical protein E5139_05550 [Halomicrobium mukohataei]QFR19938.1 hypothetical protein GBQ70_05545 [Halomicrobium sp. ZPS1]
MRFFVFITAAVVSLALLTVPIGATPTDSGNASTASPDGERIDGATVLVNSEWREAQSVALITLRSEINQTVTLTDAGAFSQGGTVPERTVEIEAGETTHIEIPVTEVSGRVGVGISTRYTLYSEIIESGSGGGLDILRALSSLQAWLAGAAIAFVWMAIAGYNVIRRENGRPEVA